MKNDPEFSLPEHYENLAKQVNKELGKRSIYAPFKYIAFILIIILATPYVSEHPKIVVAVGIAILIIGAARLYLVHLLDKLDPEMWKTLFSVGAILTAICWGFFSGKTIELYGLSNWTTLLVLLMTVGSSSTTVVDLSPNLPTLRWYLVSILAPPLFISLLIGGKQGYAVASVFAFCIVYMMIQGSKQNEIYWETLITQIRYLRS